ncbi:MAG: nucleotidyltransferase domain-containing protein [candidate division NC10 bacterium]|nr:nucleotidyltransferase domain-containing protein [candidate division NC10 bacterium]
MGILETVHYWLARRLAEVLHQAWGENLVSVVLYGSAARGTARRDSDIDVLVIAERLPQRWHERLDLFRKAGEVLEPERRKLREEGYWVDFSPLVWTREEAQHTSRLYLDMTLEEGILFDRGGFFAGVLSRLRERLARLGAVRRQVGRKWYWDLKPDYRYGEIFEI